MPDSKNEFTHLSVNDQPRMVDISEKSVTERKAVAVARVHLGAELAALLKDTGSTKKKGPGSANSCHWRNTGSKADLRTDSNVSPFAAFRSKCGH
jgi:Molybdenum cofactor biosynthesis enzyme